MNQIELPGLDAQNPLGFLAALGALVVVDHHAVATRQKRPQMWFEDQGALIASLNSHLDLAAVEALILEDAKDQGSNPALQLAYDDCGALVAPTATKAKRDLKPTPHGAREFLLLCRQGDRRTADLAAAFLSELAQDNNGNTKPTSFHFAAGQQQFLAMVEQIRAGITAEDVAEALRGPWRNESTLPSLAWDSSEARYYALRATDPSGEKRGSVPAAYWLGLQGMSLMPVVARGSRLATTGVVGGWKTSVFTWPVWETRITLQVAASLLRIDLRGMTAEARRSSGITRVLASRILRSDQGGYGSFAPAEFVHGSPTSKTPNETFLGSA
jgi:hypothetical protein